MTINAETAQLILDAIAWCNKDWIEAIEWDEDESEQVTRARWDFIRFCKARGIDTVERKIKIKTPVEKAVDDE